MNLSNVLDVPLPEFQPQPTITTTFSKFLENKHGERGHNLYIIWHGRQALYVGIARQHIWSRWFNERKSHMRFIQKYSGTREGGKWIGESPIGEVIANNFPKSLKWKVELRHYTTQSFNPDNLELTEKRLIHDLQPLFNTTYHTSPLTIQQKKLLERLTNARNF
jgi:hypothetical protein